MTSLSAYVCTLSIDGGKPMTAEKMSRYESPCAKYTYDPEAGDYERNIPPGTPFEDLPEDWCCPECGAEKEYFEELDD